MTIIEKIRAEIERRIDVIKPKPGQGFILREQITKQLQDLLSFLSTLESEQPVPNDLEERWDELQTNFREINEAYEAGKKEQREKMMQEAVEGEVVKTFPEGVASVHYLAPCIGTMAYFCKDNGLNIGDKVHIIICKKEE